MSSIRSQILIPVIAVQAVAVALLAVAAAVTAARRVESLVVGRLDAVSATLARSSFPITPSVLEALKGLSGAEFVALEPSGAIRDATIPGLSSWPVALRSLPGRSRLDPPGRSPVVEVDGSRYFAAMARGVGGPTLVILYPEAAFRRARWEAVAPPVAVGLVAIAAMAAVTAIVAHRLGSRLRALQGKTAAVADGDFRTLDPGSRHDEIADLTRAINRMCDRLREMQGAIRRTERAGVLAQLAAGLAHSLRNAATGARMAVQLHARRCPVADDDRSLDVALRQLALGEAQVKSLLSLGRPERSSPQDVQASMIVSEIAALVEPACRHARVDFRSSSEEDFDVRGDLEAIRAALLNLVLNAIEAAGPDGSVRISAHVEDGLAVFDVSDSGPGPPPDLNGSLFDPFVTNKPEGVGLGLAVAKQVAADHGGSMAWSRHDGTTRFRWQVPVLPREKAPA